jgi:quercetin 2,3-dioxygenase
MYTKLARQGTNSAKGLIEARGCRHIFRMNATEVVMNRKIDRVVPAGPVNALDSYHANRMIVAPKDFAAISPFLVLVEDWFIAPAGFPTHPHRGMETVTFVLDGALEHEDHTGGHGVLRRGDVQWMTAGHGVLHSELPHENERAHTLQLWLNLPAARKMTPARYVNQLRAEVPVAAMAGGEVRVYAGRLGAIDQPHGSDWPMSLFDLTAEAGAELALELPAAARGFVFVLSGSAKLGADATPVAAGEVAWLEPSGAAGTDRLVVVAGEKLRALLYAGPPIDESVVARGPFVMNTDDEIRRAYEDYRAGRFVAAPAPLSH